MKGCKCEIDGGYNPWPWVRALEKGEIGDVH